MNRQDNREGNRQVTIKRRTMVVYRDGGASNWLKDEAAAYLISRAFMKLEENRVAYLVRCRPKGAPSTSLNGDERGAPWW